MKNKMTVSLSRIPRLFAIACCLLLMAAATVPSGTFIRTASPAAETYTFGDEMLYFVRNTIHEIARRHIPEDYAARSLNGFQVTLDKARDAANESIKDITASSALLDSMQAGARLIRQTDSLAGELSGRQIAVLAGYIASVNSVLNQLAYHREMIAAAREDLESLDTCLSFDQFKALKLDAVPYQYIYSSISGGAPDFDISLSFAVSFDSEGNPDNSANSQQSAFFLEQLFNAQKDYESFRRQMKKYREAMRLIPGHVPQPDSCYQIYKKGFSIVKKVFENEPLLLKAHLDSIITETIDRYSIFSRLRQVIETGLLADRYRAAVNHLSLNNFNPQSIVLIQARAAQINTARNRVLADIETAKFSRNRIATFNALENIKETCAALDSFIVATDSVLLFQPIRHLLPSHRQWFSKWRLWADNYLRHGTDKSLEDFSFIQQNKAKKQKSRITGNRSITGYAIRQATEYPGALSFAYFWPGSMPGRPHHSGYPYSGGQVWTRNADGSFFGDNRAGGHANIAGIVTNLELRTDQNHKKYTKAIAQATAAATGRQSEIKQQALVRSAASRQTYTVGTNVPEAQIPSGPVLPLPAMTGGLDPKHTTTDPDLGIQIHSETQRHGEMLGRLTPEQLSAPAMQKYQQLHDQYLDYAYGLWAGGFFKEAARMFDAASGMRAQVQGFDIPDQDLPSFEPPDVPFNPFTKEDHWLIAQRSSTYETTNDNLRSKTRWFEAAAMVTRLNALGLSDITLFIPVVFTETGNFLRETNEALYPQNMLNAIKIQSGTLDESFTTPTGEVVSFKGLSGRELDYALVKYEQTKVEALIGGYKQKYPQADMKGIFRIINVFMHYHPLLPDEVKNSVPGSFDFADYNERVRLGQRIIDELYKKP